MALNNTLKKTGIVLTGLAALIATSIIDINRNHQGNISFETTSAYASQQSSEQQQEEKKNYELLQVKLNQGIKPTFEEIVAAGYREVSPNKDTMSDYFPEIKGDETFFTGFKHPNGKYINTLSFEKKSKIYGWDFLFNGTLNQISTLLLDETGSNKATIELKGKEQIDGNYFVKLSAYVIKPEQIDFDKMAEKMKTLNHSKKFNEGLQYASDYSDKNISVEWHFQHAMSYRGLKNWREAVKEFDKAIEYDNKKSWEPYSYKGESLIMDNRLLEAKEAFDIAYEKNPNSSSVNKGRDYVNKKIKELK